MTIKSRLVLNCLDDDDVLAVITIIAESTDIKSSNVFPKVKYISKHCSENISWIDNSSDIDGSTPIQVWCGKEIDLPPILLLEETDYHICIERLSDKLNNARELEYLVNNGDVLKKSLFSDGQKSFYYLRSRSYIGKGYFNIFSDKKEFKIPFEIRSKKLSYLHDYPKMIADIAEFYTSVLLQSNSPVYSYYAASEKRSISLYEDFMILDHIFGKMDLVGMFEYISKNRQSGLLTKYILRPAGEISFMDPDTISLSIAEGHCTMIDGNPVFQYAISAENAEIEDVPENRLLKNFLERINDTLDDLAKELKEDNCGTYLEMRIKQMTDETVSMLSEPWMKDIGPLNMIPFNSSVLQKKHGYRDIFIMYQMLGLGAIVADSEIKKLLEGHNKKIYQIYEYWCYVMLYRCLKDMSVDKAAYPLETSGTHLEVVPKRQNNVCFKIQINGITVNVKMLYNKEFRRNNKHYRSYSLPLRPDFTIIVDIPGSHGCQTYLINFDAKYKVNKTTIDQVTEDEDNTSDCWAYDIYKMHTYRDALLKSHGSYVLYPGDTEDWFERYKGDIIPSVGAIPMNPGKANEIRLKQIINGIIQKMILLYEQDQIILRRIHV